MTLSRKIANFRGHYVSHERKFRGHLKKLRAKSPFFEGQGKPWEGHIRNRNLDYIAIRYDLTALL